MRSDPAGAGPWLTIVIPAYNEEAGLERCVRLVTAQLAELGVSYEVLVVNDASRDRTGAIADALAAQLPAVRVIHHPENRGLGGGFVTALAEARGEWLILIPADLAMDPADLRRYLEAAAHADVVIGVCDVHSDYTPFRWLVHRANIALVQALFGMRERQFQYISLYRVIVLRAMTIDYWRSAFFHAEVLIKARALGYRLVEVDVRYVPRASGRATGSRVGLIARTVRDMFAFWVRWVARGPVAVSRRTDASVPGDRSTLPHSP